MLTVVIPGRETLELEHLVSDFNGTLAEDGHLLDGVVERLVQISALLKIHIVTADSNGTAQESARTVEIACEAARVASPHWERVQIGSEKERYLRRLDPTLVVALGNGANDEAMFRAAALSICVLGPEGACTQAMLAAHFSVTSPIDALDALLHSKRITSTLRR
ncbi:MAG: HAD family hydrolase [Ktedonobacterales bacterium]